MKTLRLKEKDLDTETKLFTECLNYDGQWKICLRYSEEFNIIVQLEYGSADFEYFLSEKPFTGEHTIYRRKK